MSKNKKIVVGIIVIAIVCAVSVILWVFRKAPDNVGSKTADVSIDAGSLISGFENNESEANTKYLGKILEVTGYVGTVTENTAEKKVTLSLTEPGAVSGVLCEFSSEKSNLIALHAGDKITIKGLCTGYLMDVVLVKCVVVKK